MRRDLMLMIETIRKESAEFQNTVVAALEAMKARRQEAFASTRHGKDFEQAAYTSETNENIIDRDFHKPNPLAYRGLSDRLGLSDTRNNVGKTVFRCAVGTERNREYIFG